MYGTQFDNGRASFGLTISNLRFTSCLATTQSESKDSDSQFVQIQTLASKIYKRKFVKSV